MKKNLTTHVLLHFYNTNLLFECTEVINQLPLIEVTAIIALMHHFDLDLREGQAWNRNRVCIRVRCCFCPAVVYSLFLGMAEEVGHEVVGVVGVLVVSVNDWPSCCAECRENFLRGRSQ